MLTMRRNRFSRWAIAFLFIVLLSNILLYRSPMTSAIITDETKDVVIGSLIDFGFIIPLLLLATFRLSWKQFTAAVALGLVLSKLIIPDPYFAPYAAVPWVALGFEGLLLIAELTLLVILIVRLPAIVRELRAQSDSPLFALLPAYQKQIKPNPLITLLLSEALMIYYAFGTWKKKAPETDQTVTLYKSTSMIAFQVMLIHAIVLESVGLHWWLHEKSAILSFVLLLFNVYSVIYFLADIQAVRLNPLEIRNGEMRISLGLSKRMTVPLHQVRAIRWGAEADKDALQFIARDFEERLPHVVIDFHEPQSATLFMGREKTYSQIAIRADEPEKLRRLLAETHR